jgi:mRNA interferase RelE/StbE
MTMPDNRSLPTLGLPTEKCHGHSKRHPFDSNELSPAAVRDLRKLDVNAWKRVFDALDRLVGNPRGADVRNLSGRDEQWRLRIPTWRIIFQHLPGNLKITVIHVVHGRDAYRR